jgi:hypothetical protein
VSGFRPPSAAPLIIMHGNDENVQGTLATAANLED